MKKVIFIIALVIFTFLRLYHLNQVPVSLFSDEVDIGYQVRSFLTTGKDYQGNFLPLQFHSFSDIRTSLPIYTTALVSLVPGISLDLAIRLTPAIFSLLSLIAIYLLLQQINLYFFSRKLQHLPFIGFLITGLMPWHFTYSRTGFELSTLFCFVIFAYYFFFKYLNTQKLRQLWISLVLFALTPLIYSTAKLSLPLFFISLFLFPEIYHKTKLKFKAQILLVFLPLVVLFLNGGAGKRFSEIAIFTDPTISTQVNYQREFDLGPSKKVGSSPALFSKLAHSKPLSVIEKFTSNLLGPISTQYLFVAGDINPRHAVQGFGMLEKVLIIPLVIGLYFLISGKHRKFLAFLLLLTILAIVPAALTRDGATHSSRNYLLIFPLTLLASVGFSFLLMRRRVVTGILFIFLFFEAFLYQHEYWYHYPYLSERDFHYGLKQLSEVALDYPRQPVVMSRTYEPNLIFYLYYSRFSPADFQSNFKAEKIYTPMAEGLNLEGSKINGKDHYFATVVDTSVKNPLRLQNGIYAIEPRVAQDLINKKLAKLEKIISFPSGADFIWVISRLPQPGDKP